MSLFLLMVAFVLTGVLNIWNKALIEWGYGPHVDLYMLGFYTTPIALGTTLLLVRRQKTAPIDRRVGLMMGVVAALQMVFFLYALRHLPGIVVFPVRNMGNLVMTAAVGIVAWKEDLSRSQKLGIALSLVAIWLIY